jgi:DNA-binding SARP family transcriptional activator
MEFRILGPLEVRQSAQPVACRGGKQRLLLATLLVHANEVVSTDRLLEALWGDEPPPTAQKALQMHVSQLRRILEPGLLLTRPPGYELRLNGGELDLQRFEADAAQARAAAAAGRPEDASSLLGRALALWRGPALADLTFEESLQPEIARLEELRVRALEDRIEADLALGRHAAVVAELEALTTAHPLRERLRGQLMIALYRSGRQAEALDVYRETRRLLVDELGLEPSRDLKALEERILAQDPALDIAERPRAGLAPEGLLGRERELGELLPLIAAALAGRGAMVLIGGEPGIGKSRLAEALARHAERSGARVAVGRCWEAGGAPTLWPWLQAINSLHGGDRAARSELLGQTLEDTGDAGARFRMFASVTDLLIAEAESAPLALFLDDIHAADTASLLLLRFVATQISDAPIVVVGCYRDIAVADELGQTLAELGREPTTHHVSLPGLDAEATSRLLTAVMGSEPPRELAQRVHAETRGNPLFAGEIGRLFAAEGDQATAAERLPVPQGVRDAIRRRLERQSDACRELLTLAAVLGREFELSAIAHVGGLDDEVLMTAIDEATAARLIGPVPGAPERLRFAHILVRDVLYEEIYAPRRLRLHRAVGEALEALHAPQLDSHIAELAHHFVAAGSLASDKAIAYTQRAADVAAAQFGYEEAARYYALTLELLERRGRADAAHTCDLLLSLGEAHSRAGNAADAKAAFRQAATLADEHGWHERLVQAALAYGGRFPWVRRSTDPALVPLLERALEVVDPGDAPARTRLLARVAAAIRDDPSPERRQALAREAVAIGRRSGDPLALAYALEGYGVVTEGIDPRATDIAHADELLAIGEQLGDKELVFTARDFRLNAFWKLADRAGVDVELEALASLADELHQPGRQWSVDQERTIVSLAEGRFAEAEQLIAASRAAGARAARWNAGVCERIQLFVLRREQGRLRELEDTIRRSVHEYPSLVRFRCALAHLLAEVGDLAGARSVLDELASIDFSREHIDAERLFTLSLLPDVFRALDDQAGAAAVYDVLAPHGRLYAHAPIEATFGAVARGLGVLATMLGRFEDAERRLAGAIEIERRARARPWLAHAQHELGAMLRARGAPGDAQKATEVLDDAIATYRALGMDTWAERAAEAG